MVRVSVEAMTPSEVRAKRRSDRLRQAALGIGGAATLTAAGFGMASPAARLALKHGGRRVAPHSARLKSVAESGESNRRRAGSIFLGGAVPGGVSSLATTRAIQRDIRSEDRQREAGRIADVVAAKSAMPAPEGSSGGFRGEWTVVKSANKWEQMARLAGKPLESVTAEGRRRTNTDVSWARRRLYARERGKEYAKDRSPESRLHRQFRDLEGRERGGNFHSANVKGPLNSAWGRLSRGGQRSTDPGLAPVVRKSDLSWQEHVSPSAAKGYRELRSGASDMRNAGREQVKGAAAGVGGTVAAVGLGRAAAKRGSAVRRARDNADFANMVSRQFPDEISREKALAARIESGLRRADRAALKGGAVLGGLAAAGGAATWLQGRRRQKRLDEKAESWNARADRIRQAGVDRMAGRRDDGPVVKMGVQRTPRPTNGVSVRRSSNASYPGPSNNMTERRGALVRRTRRQ